MLFLRLAWLNGAYSQGEMSHSKSVLKIMWDCRIIWSVCAFPRENILKMKTSRLVWQTSTWLIPSPPIKSSTKLLPWGFNGTEGTSKNLLAFMSVIFLLKDKAGLSSGMWQRLFEGSGKKFPRPFSGKNVRKETKKLSFFFLWGIVAVADRSKTNDISWENIKKVFLKNSI